MATISGTATWLTQDSRYGKQIEALTSGKTMNEILVVDQQNMISTISSELSELKLSFSQLQIRYSDLEKKYEKCINSEGSVFTIGSFDTEMHNNTLRTNDNLDFRLTSNSITIKILRISDRGPIIYISGCRFFLTDNETKSISDGENCFLLQLHEPLKLKLTSRSCSMGNSQFKEKEIEEISIENISFSQDDQQVNLEYYRIVLF